MTSSIATNQEMRKTMSSLSNAEACHVKPIQAHQTGMKSPANVRTPRASGWWCKPLASAATAATKQRSKNSSSHVGWRSSSAARSRTGRR